MPTRSGKDFSVVEAAKHSSQTASSQATSNTKTPRAPKRTRQDTNIAVLSSPKRKKKTNRNGDTHTETSQHGPQREPGGEMRAEQKQDMLRLVALGDPSLPSLAPNHVMAYLRVHDAGCTRTTERNLMKKTRQVIGQLEGLRRENNADFRRAAQYIDLTQDDPDDDDIASAKPTEGIQPSLNRAPKLKSTSIHTHRATTKNDRKRQQPSKQQQEKEGHWAIMFTVAEAQKALENPPTSTVTYDLRTGEYLSYPVRRSYHLGAMGRHGATSLAIVGGRGGR